MKTLVAVTNTGEICCLTPLYPQEHFCVATSGSGNYEVYMSAMPAQPVAYVLDAGDELNKSFSCKGPVLLNARILDKYLEILGDL